MRGFYFYWVGGELLGDVLEAFPHLVRGNAHVRDDEFDEAFHDFEGVQVGFERGHPVGWAGNPGSSRGVGHGLGLPDVLGGRHHHLEEGDESSGFAGFPEVSGCAGNVEVRQMAELEESVVQFRVGLYVGFEVHLAERGGAVVGEVRLEDRLEDGMVIDQVEHVLHVRERGVRAERVAEALAVIRAQFEFHAPDVGLPRKVGEEPRLAFPERVQDFVVHAEEPVAVLGVLQFVRIVGLREPFVLPVLPDGGMPLADLVEGNVPDFRERGGKVEADVATVERIRPDFEIRVEEPAEAGEAEIGVQPRGGEERGIDRDLALADDVAGVSRVEQREGVDDPWGR